MLIEEAILWLLTSIDRSLPRLPAAVQQRLKPIVSEWESAMARRLIRRLRHDLHDAKLQTEQMSEQIKRLSDISSADNKDINYQ